MSESDNRTMFASDTRSTETALSEEKLYAALAEDRRRRTLSYLVETGAAATLDELTTAIAAAEDRTPPTDLSPSTTRTVGIALHHVHLPKLDEKGLVEYDSDDRVVSLTVDVTAITPHL
ncbi:hypothetical protein BRC94_04195 [Halobacteriales archaeon QS_5_70_17]|nr:MAG: hypothetical protein BRC94_04195 [Halobacteriales archaeon QS_5_70_17]